MPAYEQRKRAPRTPGAPRAQLQRQKPGLVAPGEAGRAIVRVLVLLLLSAALWFLLALAARQVRFWLLHP